MSTESPADPSFKFSLKTLLIFLGAVGVATGVLGRLYFRHLEVFLVVLAALSTVVPYLLAVGTVFWIGLRTRRKGLMVWSGVLLLTPIVGIGLLTAARFVAGPSPAGLGVLSTPQLIQQRLPKQIEEPWVWNELERRLQAGSLSSAEVDSAIDELTKHMARTRSQGWDQPLSWQKDFLASAIQADMVSEPVLFALSDAFYGPRPIIKPSRVREGTREFNIVVKYGTNWSRHAGLGIELLWEVDRVLLDGTPLEFQQTSKHGEEWSGRHDGSLEAGDYELTVEVECAYVDESRLIGLNASDLPLRRWPKARKRWKQSIKAPFKVYSQTAPILTLVTDANRSPAKEIDVRRVVVQADRDDKKKVIVQIDFQDRLPIPLSCDVAAVLNGDSVKLGALWVIQDGNSRSSGGNYRETRIDTLDATVRYADIVLTPNPSHIEHRPEVSEIWGKQIVVRNVPIERLDLEAGEGGAR